MLGLMLGLAIIAVVLTEVRAQAHHDRSTFPTLRHAEPLLLAVAACAEVLSYVAPGVMLRLLAPALALGRGVRIAVAALGVGSLLPAQPLPSGGLAYRELRRAELPARTARTLAIALMVTVPAVSMAVLAGPGLVVSGTLSPLPTGWSRVVLAAAAASLVLGLATLALLWRPGIAGLVPGGERVGQAILRTGRRRAALAVCCGLAAWTADAACLYLTGLALGVSLPPAALPLAYVTGAVIIALPITPGGLGTLEATLPLVFSAAGAHYNDALLAVLAWRVLSFWVPAVAGLVSFASLNKGFLWPRSALN
jgi:uncharacterized membrane protein YbhN (UPF0104 family)